jgi:hypothetical protein
MAIDCTNPAQNALISDSSVSIRNGPLPNWWVSPDIFLNDPREGIQSSTSIPPQNPLDPLGVRITPDTARQEADNQVSVRVNLELVQFPSSADFLKVELYIANPSLVMTPNNSKLIFSYLQPKASLSPTFVRTETWRAENAILGPNPDPDPSRVHRCLIARAYPDNLTPRDGTERFCNGLRSDNVNQLDPHVAQRNIVIIPAANKTIKFLVQTQSENLELTQRATIRSIVDRLPSNAVLDSVLPSLNNFEGFRRIAQIAPERFALQVPEKFSPVIRDNFNLGRGGPIDIGRGGLIDIGKIPFRDIRDYARNIGGFRRAVLNPQLVLQEAVAVRKFNAPLNVRSLQTTPNLQTASNWKISSALEELVEQAAPTFEADITLPPEEVANFTFTANLPENSQLGDAHIFHVMHINENQQVIGGLTIVAVVVDSVNPELVNALTNQRSQLVKDGYLAIFGGNPPHGNDQRSIVACLRDLNYYFNFVVECCRQGSAESLGQALTGIKETNLALGYPNSWFITFYESIKQNHGLTGAFATTVNAYIDYLISSLS